MSLEIKKLSKYYAKHIVINNIDLTFDKSKIYGVVGPNGVGKTTLFKCIVGLIDIDEGEIFIDGKRINASQRELIVNDVSYLLSNSVIEHLSGWENAIMFAKLYKVSEEYIKDLFMEFDLYEYRNKKVKNYSLGMKQRLALAISLININRKIIILDEPYLGLDPIGIKSLNEKLLALKTKGYTIIVSNHQLHESEKIFDDVIFMTGEKIIVRKNEEKTDGKTLSEVFEEVFIGGMD